MVISPPSRAMTCFFVLTGGGLIPIGAVTASVGSAVSWIGLYLFLVGLALWGIAILFNLPAILNVRWHRLLDLSEAVLYSALIALCLACLHRIVADHPRRHDCTVDRLFTLSEQTKAVLSRLATPVRIMAFVGRGDPRREHLRGILRQYEEASPLIHAFLLDPLERPSEANRMGISGMSVIVLESGSRSVRVRTFEEPFLTAGLHRLSTPPIPVGFVVGHKERDIRGAARDQLGGLVDILELENLEPTFLTLTDEPEVPDRFTALVIPGPRVDFTIEEIRRVEKFLSKGRGVYLTLELAADPQPNLEAFLARRGITTPRAIVIDMKNHAKNDAGTLVLLQSISHPITRGINGIVLSGARPLVPTTSRSNHGDKTTGDLPTLDVLAESGKESWAERDAPREYRFTEGRDVAGPIPVAAALSGKGGRLVVVGNTLFMTDLFLGALSNRDFLIQGLSWTAETNALPTIIVDPRVHRLLMLTPEALQVIMAVTCLGMPMVTGLVGLFLFLYRR